MSWLAEKEQLEILQSRSKDARAKLEKSNDEDLPRNEHAARAAALAARIQAEGVSFITPELRSAQAESERGGKMMRHLPWDP